MAPVHRIIQIHVAAPAKPAEGADCNGCGVCCASEPCPVGVLVSGRVRGACAALRWNDGESRYRCGLIEAPQRHLPAALRRIAPIVARAARRFIAAGAGCDCSLTVSGLPTPDGGPIVRHRQEPVTSASPTPDR